MVCSLEILFAVVFNAAFDARRPDPAIFNPKNKGKKVIQEDCFCFQEVNKDDLLEWRVWRSIQKWARIYNPDGKASIPRNIEILK